MNGKLLYFKEPIVNDILLYCCNHDDDEYLVDFLLRNGANACMKFESNHSLLHIVCVRNCYKMAGVLLKYGADINQCNSYGDTSLTILLKSNKNNIIKVIEFLVLFDKINAYKLIVSNICEFNIIKELILKKIISITFTCNEYNLMYYACKCGNVDYINYLLNHCKLQINEKDIIIAFKYGHIKVFDYFSYNNIEFKNVLKYENVKNILEVENENLNTLIIFCRYQNEEIELNYIIPNKYLELSFYKNNFLLFRFLLEIGIEPSEKLITKIYDIKISILTDKLDKDWFRFLIILIRYEYGFENWFESNNKNFIIERFKRNKIDENKKKLLQELIKLMKNASVNFRSETLFEKCYFLNYVMQYQFHLDIEENGKKYINDYFNVDGYYNSLPTI